MKLNLKRMFTLMLALALSLTMLQGVAFGADASGDDWALISGILTIDNQDGMNDWAAKATDAQKQTVKTLQIQSGVTKIVGSAFENCTNLTVVYIPDTVTEIGIMAFSETGLNSITIPKSVTLIEYYAFMDCTNLNSVTFGANSELKTIAIGAFAGCTSLDSLILPGSLEVMGGEVFYNCIDLTTITFEGTPNTIPENLFAQHGNSHLAAPIATINFNGAYNKDMVDEVIAALGNAGRTGSNTPTITATQWTQNEIDTMKATLENWGITPTGGSAGSAGAGAWYIGTLTAGGSNFVPTYTQIIDTADTTAMLETGSVITVIGGSPTGIIVKLDPTALAGKQSLSINSSIADMQLTAEQIASLIAGADGNTIHITIKGTATGSTISILAGGRTITL